MDLRTLKEATVRGMAFGTPFKEPGKLLRIAVAMLVACVWGYLTHDQETQVMLIIGAMIGGSTGLLPHNRSPLAASFWTFVAYSAVTAAGLAIGGVWWFVLPVTFIGLFIAGISRAAANSLSMRLMITVMLFLIFAELSATFSDPWETYGHFVLGMAITLVFLFLPPYEPSHSGQKAKVAGLYTALAGGKFSGASLLDADRSLAVAGARHEPALTRLFELTERSEQIAQLLLALDTPEGHSAGAKDWCDVARQRTGVVADRIAGGKPGKKPQKQPAAWPTPTDTPAAGLCLTLKDTVTVAEKLAEGSTVPAASDERRTPSTLELIRAEFHPSSPIFHHAVRLAVLCIVGELLGMLIGRAMGSGAFLTGHGFWVPLTISLMMTPDHGNTITRGIGRTIGTVFGAVLGIALSFLPQNGVLHTVVLLLLFWGYLAFRSCGQPWTMTFVVAWIGVLNGGVLGATTRALDTVVGAVLALVVILLIPTWQSRLLTPRFTTWTRTEADHLDALARLWEDDTEDHRLDVAHASVRNRMARCDFTASAQIAFTEPSDKSGTWAHAVLSPAADAVLTVSRRVAALEALAPRWNDTQRAFAVTTARHLAESVRGLTSEDVNRSVNVDAHVDADTTADTEQALGGGITPSVIAVTAAVGTLDTTVAEKIRAR